jgi:hypothetical protein
LFRARIQGLVVAVFTRTWGFGPLLRIVDMAGGRRALAKLLGAPGLRYELIASPMLLAPNAGVHGIFEDAARLLGDDTFGITVGQRMLRRGRPCRWGQQCRIVRGKVPPTA